MVADGVRFQVYDLATRFSLHGVGGGQVRGTEIAPSTAWNLSVPSVSAYTYRIPSAPTNAITVQSIYVCMCECTRNIFYCACAAAMFTGGLIVFPAGFDSHFVRTICRRAGSYWPGECSVGWTAVLAVVADSLSAFCPFLSHHIHTGTSRDVIGRTSLPTHHIF
jgi:Lipoma HMGIC fusion partner-like protein